MDILGTLGLYLSVGEISKFLDERGLSPAKAEQLATKVLNAATKKGSKELQEARAALENIPAIAGSQTLKNFINKAKREAQKNYEQVEDRVTTMENTANQAASDIRAIGNTSLLSKVTDFIKTGRTSGQKAMDIVNKVENSINNNNNNEENT